jgi:hypothetical protein
MFRAIVATQWKWSRGMVLLATLIAFAVPLGSLQTARDSWNATQFVYQMQQWGVAYALLAAGLGLVIALVAWGHDHRGRHTYALSLPITRARYVLMRLGAGALFLIPPILAVLAASLIVAASGLIPEGLHAYPIAVTLRFGFAAFVAFTIFFAAGSATPRTAAIVLGVIVAVLLAEYVATLLHSEFDVIGHVMDRVFSGQGILSVFSGRWTLVDV